MINVLYITCFKVSPYKGGTERTTDTIVKELSKIEKYKFFNAYIYDIAAHLEPTKFEQSIKIKTNGYSFRLFLLENKIDVIILQGSFHLSSFIKSTIEKMDRNIYFIAAHHYNPGAEDKMLPITKLLYRLRHSSSTKEKTNYFFKSILFPFYTFYKIFKNKKMYRTTYQCADKIVLLSNSFKNDFVNYSGIKDSKKITSIPNALSYNAYANKQIIKSKEKIVLIVARMEEYQKRISYALKAWRIATELNILHGWKLIIVGSGDDLMRYRRMSELLNISDSVSFEGFQNPLSYYQKSSIFLMTSRFEGWGITLTEAMQWGCVPIAVNSYSSLTDIIDNEKNGFIVKNNSIISLVDKLKYLIANDNIRIQMANNCVEKSKFFSSKEIAEKWNILISAVCQSI